MRQTKGGLIDSCQPNGSHDGRFWEREGRNTVYKPSATYPQGREGEGGRSTPSSSQPPSFLCPSLSLSMIVVCLLACFFICSYFLPPVHIIFFAISLPFCLFPMIEYLTMQQFPHFISSLCLALPLSVHCGRAVWGRSTEKSRRGP